MVSAVASHSSRRESSSGLPTTCSGAWVGAIEHLSEETGERQCQQQQQPATAGSSVTPDQSSGAMQKAGLEPLKLPLPGLIGPTKQDVTREGRPPGTRYRTG